MLKQKIKPSTNEIFGLFSCQYLTGHSIYEYRSASATKASCGSNHPDFHTDARYAIPPAVFINPMDYVDQENWDIKLQQKGGINHSSENPSKLDSIKAVKTAAKIALVNGGI